MLQSAVVAVGRDAIVVMLRFAGPQLYHDDVEAAGDEECENMVMLSRAAREGPAAGTYLASAVGSETSI